MLVQVGPLPSGGVTQWIAYARTVLAEALAQPDEHGPLAEEAVAAFEELLDEWEALAHRSSVFLWSTEAEPERVEYLVHVWFRLAAQLAADAEARGFPRSPPEGDEFYQALVQALLDAMAQEGRSTLEFSEQLREQWPGLKDD